MICPRPPRKAKNVAGVRNGGTSLLVLISPGVQERVRNGFIEHVVPGVPVTPLVLPPTTTGLLTSAVALRARPLQDGTCQDRTVANTCDTNKHRRLAMQNTKTGPFRFFCRCQTFQNSSGRVDSALLRVAAQAPNKRHISQVMTDFISETNNLFGRPQQHRFTLIRRLLQVTV